MQNQGAREKTRLNSDPRLWWLRYHHWKFKLLDSFEGLLNRPIIQDELEKKHITLLELYKSDLKTVQSIFLEGKGLVDKIDERAPIANNLPPISGALNWTAGLLERIKEPMDRLSLLSQSIQDREEFKDVQKLYASLCKNLREFWRPKDQTMGTRSRRKTLKRSLTNSY